MYVWYNNSFSHFINKILKSKKVRLNGCQIKKISGKPIEKFFQKEEEDKNKVNIETLKYVTERYEEHIDTIETKIKAICEANNIDFALFEKEFTTTIKF